LRFVYLALSVGVFLSACATSPVTLTPQLQKGLTSVDTVVYIPQSNLNVDVAASNAGNTGLIGALIMSAIDDNRRAAAKKASVTLIDAVADFDFRGRMTRQLDAEFSRVQSVRLQTPIALETTDSESMRRMAYDRSGATAVLLTNVLYSLQDGKLIIVATAAMYPKAQELMGFRSAPDNSNPLDKGNVIYRKSFSYSKEAITRENIQAGLNEGLSNVAWQLASDINHVVGSGATASAMPTALRPLTAVAAPLPPPASTAQTPLAPVGKSAPAAEPRSNAVENVDAVPFISEKGRVAYREWLARSAPRAFAVSSKGNWFAAASLAPQDKSMPTDPTERAIVGCERASGTTCHLYAVNGKVVYGSDYAQRLATVFGNGKPSDNAAPTTSRETAVARAYGHNGFATIDDLDLAPYLSERGRADYATWLKWPAPKAFAVSPSGNWGHSSGTTPKDTSMPTDPAERALAFCQKNSPTPCKIYALNLNVVYGKE